jgi:hypothetical protein
LLPGSRASSDPASGAQATSTARAFGGRYIGRGATRIEAEV